MEEVGEQPLPPRADVAGTHPGYRSSAAGCWALPGPVALLWYVLMMVRSTGRKQGWLPPAMHQQTLEAAGRGNPLNTSGRAPALLLCKH